MENNQRANILTLTGINLNRYSQEEVIETKNEKKIIETNDYDNIPAIFDKNNWPISTDLHCPNCGLSFNTQPIPIPNSSFDIDENGNLRFQVKVITCSFSCASSIIGNTNKQALSIIHFALKNSYSFDIPNAPSKTIMKHYGGKVSIDEYRKMIINSDLSIKLFNSKINFSTKSLLELFDDKIIIPVQPVHVEQPKDLEYMNDFLDDFL